MNARFRRCRLFAYGVISGSLMSLFFPALLSVALVCFSKLRHTEAKLSWEMTVGLIQWYWFPGALSSMLATAMQIIAVEWKCRSNAPFVGLYLTALLGLAVMFVSGFVIPGDKGIGFMLFLAAFGNAVAAGHVAIRATVFWQKRLERVVSKKSNDQKAL